MKMRDYPTLHLDTTYISVTVGSYSLFTEEKDQSVSDFSDWK